MPAFAHHAFHTSSARTSRVEVEHSAPVKLVALSDTMATRLLSGWRRVLLRAISAGF